MLKIGKLSNQQLERILTRFSGKLRNEVLTRPCIGEDCAALDFGGQLCVVTTDPITGAESDIGTLAVHIACNDLASSGAEPVGLMVTLLVPPGAGLNQIEEVMSQIKKEADLVNADIIGGHTEVTDAVTRMVVSITALGKARENRVVTTSGAQPGDDIVMTKYAATEGTAILANLLGDFLEPRIGRETVARAQQLIGSISVLKEGLIAADYGATSMHDITEGGVLGAVWELCHASCCGAIIYKENIPLLDETRKICACLGLDPLRLISSGSMLITCKDGNGLVEELQEAGIRSCIIGNITRDKQCMLADGGNMVKIDPPESDELYKARKLFLEGE
ncbi:MAG TPA: AIR synthase family protein [Thermoclostridium caenicola]|uniref:AIR synthase family protein n=1 Tax=Thermoclostridium caenicola TaxID=659425 RepID=UPI002C0B1A6D|nr:AIR synthase family protein [Thermoclostridium caenicola]HOK42332.1 AIR synthase family protein [Thermoclostridium caenicola]HOL84596.1 AIR synthase family protein [Thermoclostridium caenicola]HOP72867.1 AIR synthase family protein [Thermoclostridium caenicola]HPO76384.1 AIR synthase family protein [Thermoclostridium caenicola]HPU22330.1 AIR synthase family protein [Thermoclostridium caenicola]